MKNDSEKTLNQLIVEGVSASAQTAVNASRISGVPLVYWQDGKMIDVNPEELQEARIEIRS